MAQLLKGAPVAKALTEELSARVNALAEKNVHPSLAIVRVGEREDDLSYERAALKRAEKVGLVAHRHILPSGCTQAELEAVIRQVNADPAIHGCLLFRPLPAHLDEVAACALLDPAKDVDGITQGSLYGVFAGQRLGYAPCTPAAVMQMLDYYGVVLAGTKVVVVGRSLVVGRPVAMMLQQANATVTMCHTRTADLAAECCAADVVVVATGHAGSFGADCARAGQVVIDVGINWDQANQCLCGDVAFGQVEPIVSSITPVPGGVGAVTTAVLAKHVVEAAERSLTI